MLPRDHPNASAIVEQIEGGAQPGARLAKLVIQVHAQRLEGQLRGVHRLILFPLGLRDQARELTCATRQRLLGTREADGVGDAACGGEVRGLAVLVQHADQLHSLHRLEPLPRGHALALVEP